MPLALFFALLLGRDAADEQTADDGFVCAFHFFFGHFADPFRRLHIEVIVIHGEEDIAVPFVPLLAHHVFGVTFRSGKDVRANLVAFVVQRFADGVDKFRDVVAAELSPFRN